MQANALPFAAQPRIIAALDQRCACCHLGNDQTGTKFGGQPPERRVTPDIGASTTGFGSLKLPIATGNGRKHIPIEVT